MAILYYCFYSFYKHIRKTDDPHILTVMALSASEAFFSSAVLSIVLANFFCCSIDERKMFAFIPIYLLINYLYFIKSRRHLEIVAKAPLFFNNAKISAFITLLFFLVTASSPLWGILVTERILDNCNLTGIN